MKNILIKTLFLFIFASATYGCKKEVYPEELHFLVVDSFTRNPIPNATVQLVKVWRHPVKMGNNAKDDAWFPKYGRKHINEIQTAVTDENGKVSFMQEHKNYLYILPGAMADGYQIADLDTLKKIKKHSKDAVYTIALQPKIKTTFIFKSHSIGNEKDSIVFSSCDKIKVMKGANIDDRLEVYISNFNEPSVKVWYGGTVYRAGKKETLCDYVVAKPNAKNEFNIDIDL